MSKGDWQRPTDDKKYQAGYGKAFGSTCRLNHKHNRECEKEKTMNKNDLVTLLRTIEHFFAFPEEYSGPEQADLHCALSEAVVDFEGSE